MTALEKKFVDVSGMTVEDLLASGEQFIKDAEENQVEQKGWPKNSYRVSKILVNAYTRLLAKRVAPKVTVVALCPGWCRTDMGGNSATRSAEEGAEVAVFCATSNSVESGKFYAENKEIQY